MVQLLELYVNQTGHIKKPQLSTFVSVLACGYFCF